MYKEKQSILIVFGTRPEAIKMAPLIKVLSSDFNLKVCVTAQHRKMLDQVLELFEIEPDFDLDLMKSNQDLFTLTSEILSNIKKVYDSFNPDLVLVHGDTTTSMVSALGAFYSRIPVGHIEAGLRTHDLYSPFPEEANRQIISRIAKFHFTPTDSSKKNLIKEGISEADILVTGNTVIDSIIAIGAEVDSTPYEENLLKKVPFLRENNKEKYILVTGHRRENFGKGFEEICKALKEVALNNPKLNIIYPVHLNPNVQKPVNNLLSNVSNIYLIEPLSYLNFVKLMKDSYMILTDSGGIQEEAPSLGKPVLVMRDTSERPEAIEAGTAILVGANAKNIIKQVQNILDSEEVYNKMTTKHNPFGNGTASIKINEFLVRELV
jgi:UDP-N-acetylglucosamine 2-epimerase (non-hydrolysing)